MSIGLMHIETILISEEYIADIYEKFQQAGKEGYERLALLAGQKKDKTFLVTTVIYPQQILSKGPDGVSFYVEGKELDRIWNWLYENQASLVGQVHSHPAEAYHSAADDALAIITNFGGISIVVPDFGFSDQSFEKSAFFRLWQNGWIEQSRKEIKCLFKISN